MGRPTSITPKIEADHNLKCPECGAIVKPGLQDATLPRAERQNIVEIGDTVAAWLFHVKQHARERRNKARRAAYAADPEVQRRRAVLRARQENRAAQAALEEATRTAERAALMARLGRCLPLRTPLLAIQIHHLPTPRPPLSTIRRIARKLGLIETPNTNPIIWSFPLCAKPAENSTT